MATARKKPLTRREQMLLAEQAKKTPKTPTPETTTTTPAKKKPPKAQDTVLNDVSPEDVLPPVETSKIPDIGLTQLDEDAAAAGLPTKLEAAMRIQEKDLPAAEQTQLRATRAALDNDPTVAPSVDDEKARLLKMLEFQRKYGKAGRAGTILSSKLGNKESKLG